MNAKDFSSRFSFEDWSELCSLGDFTRAVEAGEFDRAEVIAHEHFQRRDEAGARVVLEWERRHAEARALVAQWAAATGRTGGDHKQARQSRIRRIVKHGIDSDYARAIRAEAGMIVE